VGRFHVECAHDADELSVTAESKLFGADNHCIECPCCERNWSAGYDPR